MENSEQIRSIRQGPGCGVEGYVVDTRTDAAGHIRRRRRCPECRALWYTQEVLIPGPQRRRRK